MPYKIEKGIPLAGHRNKWVHLLNSMDIGDSFVLEPGDNTECVRQAARNIGIKVSTKRENNSVRIWRVK